MKDIVMVGDSDFNSEKIRIHIDKNLPLREVNINDIRLHVLKELGDILEEERSCDSEHMMDAIDILGATIQRVYY